MCVTGGAASLRLGFEYAPFCDTLEGMPVAHTTLKFASGPVVVVLQDTKNATDQEWKSLVNDVAEAQAEHSSENMWALVASDGGAPTLAQRRELKDLFSDTKLSIAVLSDSPLVRGAVMAMSWFNDSIRVFSPAQFTKWMNYVPISPGEEALLRSAIRELQKKVPCQTITAAMPAASEAQT